MKISYMYKGWQSTLANDSWHLLMTINTCWWQSTPVDDYWHFMMMINTHKHLSFFIWLEKQKLKFLLCESSFLVFSSLVVFEIEIHSFLVRFSAFLVTFALGNLDLIKSKDLTSGSLDNFIKYKTFVAIEFW